MINISNQDNEKPGWPWRPWFNARWGVDINMLKLPEQPQCADRLRTAGKRWKPRLSWVCRTGISAYPASCQPLVHTIQPCLSGIGNGRLWVSFRRQSWCTYRTLLVCFQSVNVERALCGATLLAPPLWSAWYQPHDGDKELMLTLTLTLMPRRLPPLTRNLYGENAY